MTGKALVIFPGFPGALENMSYICVENMYSVWLQWSIFACYVTGYDLLVLSSKFQEICSFLCQIC